MVGMIKVMFWSHVMKQQRQKNHNYPQIRQIDSFAWLQNYTLIESKSDHDDMTKLVYLSKKPYTVFREMF